MTKEEVFHRQLINSYVSHVANTPFEEFMVRSEIFRRTREFTDEVVLSRAQYERASTAFFFDGDRTKYHLAFNEMSPDPDHIYTIQTKPFGNTTLTSILRSLP